MGTNVAIELTKAIIIAKPELLVKGKEASSAWKILIDVVRAFKENPTIKVDITFP